ncbi:beta strand repeat-containing protein [Winogradskyella sp.]|uniref:beta strand repeat-containing protein n=1 Tax=Winogradskyella sp. TaxID=1883156 RepID=UPI0035110BDF
MKTIKITLLFLLCSLASFAQVGIGNTDPKASLDITSSNLASPANTDGILIPRIDNFPSTNPAADQDGMMVFVTGNGTPTKGFYYWDNGSGTWVNVLGVRKINDLEDAKSDNDGSDDGSSIYIGENAGSNDDQSNNNNVGLGKAAMNSNTSGNYNVGIGFQSLLFNSTGVNNTAVGTQSLLDNNGDFNTAIGTYAINSNISGDSNTAVGWSALSSTVDGNGNTAIGNNAGFGVNGNSSNNIFIGNHSGYKVPVGSRSGSIFIGYFAGSSETNNNRLYIENSNADENNALIYGEFDNNLLRTNGEFQIGNPSGTGYALPTTDGTTGQVMTTDGAGNITFEDLPTYTDTDDQNIQNLSLNMSNILTIDIENGDSDTVDLSSLDQSAAVTANTTAINNHVTNDADTVIGNEVITAATLNGTDLQITEAGSTTSVDLSALSTNDSDWYVQTGSSTASDINDDIYTLGNVSIGRTTSYAHKLYIDSGSDPGTYLTGSGLTSNFTLSVLNPVGRAARFQTGNAGFSGYLSSNVAVHGIAYGTNAIGGFFTSYDNGEALVGQSQGSGTAIEGWAYGTGLSGYFHGGQLYAANGFRAEGNVIINENGSPISDFRVESNADPHMLFVDGGNNKIGIGNSLPQTELHIDGDVRVDDELQIGNPATTGYVFPTTDGTDGQVITTDGAGTLTFQNAAVNTDNQQIDDLALSGTILGISLQNDGVVPVSVDLASVNTDNQQIDNLALSGTTLGVSLQNDGVAPVTVDLASINTDNQQIDNFSFNTTTNVLTLEMEDDGQAAQTVDLSSLNPDKSLARIIMGTNQTTTVAGWQKINYDIADFDLGGDFNTSTDTFDVPNTGYYRINASWRSGSSSTLTSQFGIAIYVNGAIQRAKSYDHTGSGLIIRSINRVMDLNAGDTVEIYLSSPSGFTISSIDIASSFEIEQIR